MTKKEIQRRTNRFLWMGTTKDLARLLDVRLQALQLLALNPRYTSFRIPKKKGGFRLIEKPEYQLSRIQRALNEDLQVIYKRVKPAHVFGFVRMEKRTRQAHIAFNAEVHLGQKFVLNIDLKDFFHSISSGRVREIFMSPPFEYDRPLASMMALLTTHYNHLPMGAPSSPVISNLACLVLDRELQELAESSGWNYSRYADDLSFSGNSSFDKAQILQILDIINKQGFQINPRKFRMQPHSMRQTVTGVVVNEKVNLPRPYYRKLRAILHHWKTAGLSEATQKHFHLEHSPDPDTMRAFHNSVRGKISYYGSIRGQEDPLYKKLMDAYGNCTFAVGPEGSEYFL